MLKLDVVNKLMVGALIGGTLLSGVAYAEGADGSGGGEGTKSSKEEVLNVLKYATAHSAVLYMNARNFRLERIKDRELKEMVEKIILPAKEPPFQADNPPIRVQDEPCKEEGKDKDMSTDFHRGATICVSVGMLRRYSEESLHRQISSLMMHELAHQYGYKEKAAKKLQDLYLRAYELPMGFSDSWANRPGDPLGTLVKLETQNPDVWKKKSLAKKWLQASQDVCTTFGNDINVYTSPIEKAAHLGNIPKARLEDMLGGLKRNRVPGDENENIQVVLIGRLANPCRLKGEAAYDLPRLRTFKKVREYIVNLAEDYVLGLTAKPAAEKQVEEEENTSGAETGSAE